MVRINQESVVVRELKPHEKPLEVDVLPVLDKLKTPFPKVSNGVDGNAVMVCADGVVRIVDLSTLKTACFATIETEKFVSAAYCNSLDRLCTSTKEGSLHFFALNDSDNESVDDHEEDDLFGLNVDNSMKEILSLDKLDTIRCFREPPIEISLNDLRTLQKLTLFSPVRFAYNVVVPPCWSEFQQAMRQRRNSSIVNTEAFTKTWRLQTDTTTWEEHIFEITLPSAVILGHVDVHFTLQSGCTKPCVEVSLLRQTKSGIGHNRDVKFSVDDTVTIDMLRRVENPVVSEEYLRAHNADILAGPVNIAHYLDLAEQGGTVTLTSPRMFKVKVRNLLLHVRAVYDKDDKKPKHDSKGNPSSDKSGLPNRKSEQYLGCDSIHELSIAVYTSTNNMQNTHEKTLRNLMLDSNSFVQSLITTAIKNNNREVLKHVLDILNWIAAIRLIPNRGNNGEAPSDQLEFMFINGIEENMSGLFRQCLLLGSRSVAHKCMNYVMTCCRGAKNINKSLGDHFNSSVLNSLLSIMSHIKQIKSAAGLHWLLCLLLKVTKKDNEQLVTSKCVELLTEVSNDLIQRSNPYHLLLRSRYGLYGVPTEPELFDVDPPQFAKGSSTSSTPSPYIISSNVIPANDASSSITMGPEISQPVIPNKETFGSGEPASENKLKYKSAAFPKLVKGLIEAEPLHFTCINSSEGTRLEMADSVSWSVQTKNNVFPVVFAGAPEINTLTDVQQLFQKNHTFTADAVNRFEKLGLSKMLEEAEQALDQKMEIVYKNLLDYEESIASKSSNSQSSQVASGSVSNQSTVGSRPSQNPHLNHSHNQSLPWQQLLIAPPKQVIAVDRMHSGARRHVTLDFGDSVLLTDILIPACPDLMTLTIDVWLFGEEIDSVRLVSAGDIGTKNLVLNDLQPPPLCQYMKITLVGRYGMSTTRCRIPLGYFYGHVVVLPEEIPRDLIVIIPTDCDKQLAILSKLLEDISCRYSLACSKLKDYLQPFLIADMKNTLHLSSYISILKDKSQNITNAEYNKIYTAYQETLTYQHQLNTVRNVMSRIESSVPESETTSPFTPSQSVSTDKLTSIAEGLLEVLLSIDGNPDINQELCQHFFQGLCVSQTSRLQLLAAVFLEKSCGSGSFWGNFLADTFVNLFSTSCTEIFPQDRLFVLLIYLSRKSPERSAVIDAAMRVVHNTLKPIETNRSLLLAVNVDLSLLSWLLMYLSLQLTGDKSENDRWDWVLGEMVGKVNEDNAKNNARKKTVKRVAPTFGTSGIFCHYPSPYTVSDTQAKSKLLAWKKHQWSTKDFKPCKSSNVLKRSLIVDMYKTCEGQGDPTCLRDLITIAQKPPQFVDTAHCIAVSKVLLTFIRTMDHSGSADMVLLSFKIISRLVTMAKLQLCQLLTADELLDLINFSLACKVPWAPFALSCFLQDALDLYKDNQPNVTEMDTDVPTSSTWPSENVEVPNVEGTNDKLMNSVVFINLEENDHTTHKTMNNMPFSFPPLPSVFETDSNDSDIEDVLEAFEKVRCTAGKNSKTSIPSASPLSTTIDARLETGVCAASEIALRKLTARNAQKLMQNMGNDKYKHNENPLTAWPETVGPFSVESTLGNLKMLSYCFDELFKNLQTVNPNRIENILNLWLTLNCARRNEKFDSSAMPVVFIKVESVKSLISALAWTQGMSLTTWCLGLQALTLVCNTNNSGKIWFDLSGMADVIVSHRDFVQMFVSLLSGSGIAFTEKGVAGPNLCKALHDFLVRLQVRCDIVSQSSRVGNLFKTLLLNVVYQMAKPGGPISTRMGPLDAQCKLLQSILFLDFTNIDISIGMSTLESTASLLSAYFLNIDNIKCVTMGDKQYVLSNTFGDIFASVLGTDSNKQDRPVSYEDLLISLLKLLGKLVQTPIMCSNNSAGRSAMEVDEPAVSVSQTDESKAEQIHQTQTDNFVNPPTTPFFADTVLQHHPTIISLCRCLAVCKSSSLCMLTNLSQKTFTNFAEPNSVGDAIFHILSCLSKKAARKELIMEPLLMFLSQTPQLSEPLIWFVLQVLDNEEAIKTFYTAGGIQILSSSIVNSSNTPSTISRNGTISTVMQHFNGFMCQNDSHSHLAPSLANKLLQASMENSSLINFAPYSTITCQSVTSQPPDILIQGLTGVTHRRARTPLWSYNYYQEETHTELLLQLPSAVLLKEVQLQPHAGGLATCPSFVAIETSANGPSRLVPACNPLPTSGLTYIRLHLPTAKVVNCVLIRLYKPRVGNSIGLLQIRLLGTYAFGKNASTSNIENEDDVYCNHSLGWLRILHHCFTISIDSELRRQLVESASQVSNLLNTCCGLLLVPSYILPVYLPCLEKVLRELALLTPENGVATIRILLDNRLSIVEPMMSLDNTWQERLTVNVSGYQSACELLYQICEHQDSNTGYRVQMILEWLKTTAEECLQTENTSKCSAAYVSSIASILWFSNQTSVLYDLKSLVTLGLFETIYNLKMRTTNNSLKYALDSLLCSLCYTRSELFPILLQKIGVLVPNLSTDRAASISDDRKDTKGMTDDGKQDYFNSEWYNHLIIGELSELNLSKEQLETVALASRSPTAIRQLLDSGLPKLLNSAIYEFCNSNEKNATFPMAKLEKVTSILQFFTDVCDEKMLRDWLGSPDGSSFWPHLLHWLCKKPFSSSNIQSEAHVHLEEVCVKFLAKCCLCHSTNQARLAAVLCEVISQQQNGISGFLRRLILQLLLENEKVPVSIEADETLYKTSRMAQAYVPAHPAFKQTYNRTMLYLSTTTTLGEILEQHLFFSTTYKLDSITDKKSSSSSKKDMLQFKVINDLSDLSVAAGVTAKDKRAKDLQNAWTGSLRKPSATSPQSKKKRYTPVSAVMNDVMQGRLIKCLAFPDESLPLNLNLGQLLKLMESKNSTNNWPYVHLTICQSKGNEEKNQNKEALQLIKEQQPVCSALQVFSSIGGLALLAQNLPTIYPEAVRVANQEKSVSDQSDSEWIKLEESDDIYEDMEEAVSSSSPSKSSGTISHIPPHSLTAFGLFLRLPGYAEVLLKDTKKALCLLRLMLGVTDDGEGGDIFQSPVASSLPTLPFEVLQKLYDSSPLCSDDGCLLRRISITTGVVQLLLACLGILTHHAGSSGDKDSQKDAKTKEDRQLYWAKGTGFGTGSTQQSWNVEQALMKQKNEEEHVTVLLQVLASYINPNDESGELLSCNVLPSQFVEFLAKSSLLPAISSYLRNDSVLDMARHIPLYKAVLKILRALALSAQLVKLLLPQKAKFNDPSVSSLLKNMKTCVDTYANKLRIQNTKSEKNGKTSKGLLIDKIDDLEQGEGLATLMPDIQNTASLVAKVTFGMVEETDSDRDNSVEGRIVISAEEGYMRVMKDLQFASHDMIEEQIDGSIKFVVSYHFESMAKATSDQSHPARVKRIAQETVTLSTSLPLSYSSSVFVRYDSSRLDVMKVLITGPADTPYANGCFQLDVFFPPDYPLSPMQINLETTGHHTVRFNPNLYNDGKVCLSVLNTWHGRPEEKWNAQTSSFLQVLVSIQSLILVPEPYFNEPGYERARGTPAGTVNSKDYNQNICQATVRWAMLEQILNPCPCFKDVINTHFYLKRHEVLAQVAKWIEELEVEAKKEKKGARVNKKNRSSSLESFKKTYKQLQEQLAKLKPPAGDYEECSAEALEEEDEEESPTTPTNSMEVSVNQEQPLDPEQEMEILPFSEEE
ncbi:baculoviral IAP repeat-containing protein 6 isoform X2 [Euwallacea similis]|uniref:baculoviral IAP repeat-containing protein 6 isoform X2 n=1 Tax=Euwallacea similis TaxID=1736056 RepID=UPI003450A8A4